MALSTYAIALGSNRRHGAHGGPAAVLKAAIAALEAAGITVERHSPILSTPALGPAGRSFANAAAILTCPLLPPALLRLLKGLETDFGRRRGRTWGPRVLDLDILLWSGGCWVSPGLVIPHPEMRRRVFVLQPLSAIAAEWRDPISGRTVGQLLARLSARSPLTARPRPPR